MRRYKKYDAVVVGAGPSGSTVARRIAGEGFSVLLLEKRLKIGHPNHCAGLISPRTLKLANLRTDSLVHNEIKGMILHSPSGKKQVIQGKKVHGLAINRPLFDTKLAREAQKAGAHLRLGTKALALSRQEKNLKIHLKNQVKNEIVEAKLLIGADGARSVVAGWAGLSGPSEVIKAVSLEAHLPNCLPDSVEVFLCQSLTPGWFAWIIPLNKTKARLGLGTTQGLPAHYLKKLMTAFPHRFRGIKILNSSSGLIPLGLPKQIYADRVLLVGDAACQVKPTSGGGIYTGLLAAKICARAAIQALKKDDLSAKSLQHYQVFWQKQMGEEFRIGMFLRRVFTKLGDKDFEKLVNLMGNKIIRRLVSNYGDIDYPSRLLDKMIYSLPGLKALSSLRLKSTDDNHSAKKAILISRRLYHDLRPKEEIKNRPK